MLTGDLDRLLAAEISALPPPAVPTTGTWQPAPPDSAPAPGTYATSVAFRLAGRPAKAQGIARENLALAKDRMGFLPRADG